jgi:hypothetical protein
MWSGPRNLSTAMMRSFENRADCAVWDEPFYVPFLLATGIDHPMREIVLTSGVRDPKEVIEQCLGPAPGDARVFYQKHMTHHMLPAFERDWIKDVTNVFLIRAPEFVVASYAKKRESATLSDIGFVEQKELFDQISDQLGAAPVVVDATDIQTSPKPILTALCSAIGLPFDDAMLNWPAGRRDSDGAWGAHWYNAVIESTGFAPPHKDWPDLPDDARRLADSARPYYEALQPFALSP